MKIIEQIKERVTNLLTAPVAELGRWTRFVQYQLHLWRFCAKRLKKDNAMAMSAAMSFRTLFAIIPALVLAVLLLKPLGLLETSKVGIEQFLATAALDQIAVTEGPRTPPGQPTPPTPEQKTRVINLADFIERLVNRVERKLTFGRVGPVGVLLLIWTVVTLLTTMERSLNRIFDARRVRPFGRRILLYWSVVTLVPLLLATAVYLAGVGTSVLRGIPVLSKIMGVVGWVEPIVVGILLLATVYTLMPNTKVRFRSALAGAAVAAPLWMIAKWGLGVYVANLVGRVSLYGTLGLLPLFLIWLNLSWLLFFFGAEIAHTAASLEQMQAAERAERFAPTPSTLLAAAVAVARPFTHGDGPVPTEQVARKLNLPHESTDWLVDKLVGMGIITRVETSDGAACALARPADRITMSRILEIDEPTTSAETDTENEITAAVASFKGIARDTLGQLTLADILARSE